MTHKFMNCSIIFKASLLAQTVKNLPTVQETWIQSLGWEDPLEKKMATYSSILPGKFHGQRSLVGYSPKGPNELHATEHKCLEKCIVSLLTMLSIPSISAEPSTKRTMHKYLLLLTFKIKILNNNQIHG